MWAITTIIEAYEGFHSARLGLQGLKDGEIGEFMTGDTGKDENKTGKRIYFQDFL